MFTSRKETHIQGTLTRSPDDFYRWGLTVGDIGGMEGTRSPGEGLEPPVTRGIFITPPVVDPVCGSPEGGPDTGPRLVVEQ